MHGLTINFELRRQRKLNNAMNYIIVLALAIFAFVGLIYIPYLSELEQLNSSKEQLQLAINHYEQAKSENVQYQSSSTEELIYSSDYNTLIEAKVNYSLMIEDIEEVLNNSEFECVSLNNLTFDTVNQVNFSGTQLTGPTVQMIFTFDSTIQASTIKEKKFQLLNAFKEKWTGSFRIDSNANEGMDSTPRLEMTLYYGSN